ncbi:TadE/TadG family type IV pilus assembly protein [Thalassobacillus devorans]|uniref:TadE/TadG family type IV pilus assembly protein n=1 Tax=Thalassobacillus devorans TaxID=279813 RepID=UPI0004B969FC|nr:TadE family protein [Thalassobacillus devorans]
MKSNKGQALVEMALVLPILLMLLFGIVDFGRIFHAYLTIDHVGREAARLATVQQYEDGEIKSRTLSSAVGLNLTEDDININPNGKANRSSGDDVIVTVTYKIGFITPLVNTFISSLTLTDKTVMRVE